MKIYSDSTVSKAELSAIDEKQTRQIVQLRWAIGASFVVNLILTAVLAVQVLDMAQLFK